MHRLLADEEARRGAQVYRSYTRFLWDLARWIARAYGPRGASLPLHLRRSAPAPIAAPA